MKYTFSLGVVFYNPTKDQIYRIRQYSECGFFEKIYVCDNSKESLDTSVFPSNVDYLFLGSNSGLSIPYNKIIKLSLTEGFDFLCILDQDSHFESSEINKIVNFIIVNPNILKDVALVGPFIETEYKRNKTECEYEFVRWTINSGSFLNLEIIKENDIYYDENIFLDGVDYEFCWNIRKKKKKILRLNTSSMFQSFGYLSGNRHFSHHDAPRYYNIAHNRKYIFQKYYGIVGYFFAILINMRLACRIILHEDNKKQKVWACVKGTIL